MTADEVLAAINHTDAAIAALPSDDFAARFQLQTKGDELRARLRELKADELDAAADEWAERAAMKNDHEELDPEIAASQMNRFMDGGVG